MKVFKINDRLFWISHMLPQKSRVFRPEAKRETAILNTENFYSTNISELQNREKSLVEEVAALKKKNQKYAGKEKEIDSCLYKSFQH